MTMPKQQSSIMGKRYNFRKQGKVQVGYMKTVLGRIASDVKEYGIAVAVFFVYAVITNLISHAFCPLIIFCGLPCPGCGVTRATLCLMTGRWQQAWQLNPMAFPIALTAVYFAWNRYLLGRKAVGIKAVIIALLVLLIVIYGVRMYLYFPNRVPYIYAENNMLARMFSAWRQAMYRFKR